MSRVSATVRELFDSKAATWGRKYDPSGALQSRISAFRDGLDRLRPKPARVLELGCGTGNLAHALSQCGYQVDACDFSSHMIDAAQAAYPQPDIAWHLLPTHWRQLPFADGTFQAAVASSVFEYLDDVGVVFHEVARVLAPGGYFLLTVPNVRHPIRRIEQVLSRCLRVPMIARIASRIKRTQQYARYLDVSKNRLTQREWVHEAQRAGFASMNETAKCSQLCKLTMLILHKAG